METCPPLLSTGHGGTLAIDEPLLRLWRAAEGRSLHELVNAPPDILPLDSLTRESLACLAEGGCLSRIPDVARSVPALRALGGHRSVSAVIVVSVPDEVPWLERCLPALEAQHHRLDEIIVVDNGSTSDLSPCVSACRLPSSILTMRRRTN